MATAKPKKPVIEYYWARDLLNPGQSLRVVNTRIIAANGEIVGQITQGSKDKRDARRCVNALAEALGALADLPATADYVAHRVALGDLRERGPGPKPVL